MRFRVLETKFGSEDWAPIEIIKENVRRGIARFRCRKHAMSKMPGRLEEAHEVRLQDLDSAGVDYRVSEIFEAPDGVELQEMFQIWEEAHAKTQAT